MRLIGEGVGRDGSGEADGDEQLELTHGDVGIVARGRSSMRAGT
jgi:hypothetical protein